jgi:hypothetical protein
MRKGEAVQETGSCICTRDHIKIDPLRIDLWKESKGEQKTNQNEEKGSSFDHFVPLPLVKESYLSKACSEIKSKNSTISLINHNLL